MLGFEERDGVRGVFTTMRPACGEHSDQESFNQHAKKVENERRD